MWICLTFLLRPGSCIVAICDVSIVIPPGSLSLISFSIIAGAIVGVAFFARCIFAPESVISSMLVLVGLGEVSI